MPRHRRFFRIRQPRLLTFTGGSNNSNSNNTERLHVSNDIATLI
jgi:hypothetical protein